MMEDERKIELEILKKCIEDLMNFQRDSLDCESVMPEQYHQIGEILDDLENKKILLEIDIEGVSYEEI